MQVINHFGILKTKSDKETFIKAVLKRKDNIFYLPNELKTYMQKYIKNEICEYKEFFEIMLNAALNQSKTNPLPKLYKSVLGGFYGKANKIINKYKSKEV